VENVRLRRLAANRLSGSRVSLSVSVSLTERL